MCNQSQQSLSAVISLCKSCGEELLAFSSATPPEAYVPVDKQKLLQVCASRQFSLEQHISKYWQIIWRSCNFSGRSELEPQILNVLRWWWGNTSNRFAVTRRGNMGSSAKCKKNTGQRCNRKELRHRRWPRNWKVPRYVGTHSESNCNSNVGALLLPHLQKPLRCE